MGEEQPGFYCFGYGQSRYMDSAFAMAAMLWGSTCPCPPDVISTIRTPIMGVVPIIGSFPLTVVTLTTSLVGPQQPQQPAIK